MKLEAKILSWRGNLLCVLLVSLWCTAVSRRAAVVETLLPCQVFGHGARAWKTSHASPSHTGGAGRVQRGGAVGGGPDEAQEPPPPPPPPAAAAWQRRVAWALEGKKLGPSVLAADLSRLAEEAARVLAAGADYIHLDVFDGHYIDNLTFGPPVVRALRRSLGPRPVLSAHLSARRPQKWVDEMADAGVDVFTFHLDSDCGDPVELIRKIKARGMLAGVALGASFPAGEVLPLLPLLDLVLVMTVEPGFGGQGFQEKALEKISIIRAACKDQERENHLVVEVDGGINSETIIAASAAGADWFVSGTTIFSADDPAKTIAELKAATYQTI